MGLGQTGAGLSGIGAAGGRAKWDWARRGQGQVGLGQTTAGPSGIGADGGRAGWDTATNGRGASGMQVVALDLAGQETGQRNAAHKEAFSLAHRKFMNKTVRRAPVGL